MKRILLALWLLLLPSVAQAQCNGVFAAHTVCGNNTANPGIPGQVPQASIIGPGGTNGSIQYNNGGFFGGVSGTANQIPVFPGGTAAPVATPASTWFDNAYCNTIGYIIARTTGGWVCTRGIPVNIVWLGAIADGSTAYSSTNATTNATALTTALATGSCAFIPYNVNGYSFAGSITINSGNCIQGENQVLVKSQATTQFLDIVSFNYPFTHIENIHIDMTGSGASSTAFLIDTTAANVYAIKFDKIYATNCVHVITDVGTFGAVDVSITNFRSALTRGTQIYFKKSLGLMYFQQVQIDNTSNVGAVTWNGIQFDLVAGIELNAVDVIGPTTGSYQSGVYGIQINGGTGSAAVWMERVNVDTTTGNGIGISLTNFLWLSHLDINANLGNAVVLTATNTVEISDSFIGGGFGRTGAAAGAAGLSITSSNDVHVVNLTTTNNVGSGVIINGTSNRVNLGNVSSTLNGFPYALQNTASNVIFLNGAFASNSSGVSNTSSGTGNIIKDISGYNPIGATAAQNVGASPATVCAGTSPETHYLIQSATNTATVTQGGVQILALSNANNFYTVQLNSNECYIVTWLTTQPTYTKFVH